MPLFEILRKLSRGQEVNLQDIGLTDKETAELALLLKRSRANRVSLTPQYEGKYRPRRFALLIKTKLVYQARQSRPKRVHVPKAGRFGKIPQDRKTLGSRKQLSAIARIESRKRSGTLRAKVADPQRLQSVTLQATAGPIPVLIFFWDAKSMSHYSVVNQPDPAFLSDQVFGGAYIGDLAELTFQNVRAVIGNVPFFFPEAGLELHLRAGSNLVAQLLLPTGFHRVMPSQLVIFGAYSRTQQGRTAELTTAPRFPLTLGYLKVGDCFINIVTQFEAEAWDTFASIVGKLFLFEVLLGVSSDLPPATGLLSFNLESRQCPVQKDFRLLAPLTNNNGRFLAVWQDSAAFNSVDGYRLDTVNIVYDLSSPGLVTVSFGVVCNPVRLNYPNLGLSVDLGELRFDWVIGAPEAEHIVSAEGSARAVLSVFPGVVWEATLNPYPEQTVECWAEADQLDASFVAGWTKTNISMPAYAGCMVKLFSQRVEVYVREVAGPFHRLI